MHALSTIIVFPRVGLPRDRSKSRRRKLYYSLSAIQSTVQLAIFRGLDQVLIISSWFKDVGQNDTTLPFGFLQLKIICSLGNRVGINNLITLYWK